MIAATRRWFRRNRTTLAVGAACIGATYLAGQYVVSKIQEARQRMSEERVGKENLRRRFEQNQEDCTYTVLALLPTIREEVIGALPVEQITEQLQQERQERLRRAGASEAASSEFPSAPGSVTDDAASALGGSYLHASQVAGSESSGNARSKRSKAQLWQEMKIHSIARALTLLYTVAFLTLLTRIQLNLLGRRTYLSSVVSLATPQPPMESSRISLENRDDDNYDNFYGNDFDTNRKYLTFSWWLLHRGSKQIMDRVMGVVKEVFGGVNIREDMTLERLADLIMQCRRKIEGETEQDRREMKWLQYLLPPQDQESFVIRQSAMSENEDSPSPEAREKDDPMTASFVEAEAVSASLRRLLDETSDLIDSPTFTHVLTRLLDASFSHLVDYRIATESFKVSTPGAEQPRIQELTDSDSGPVKCKLAHILPVFCRQAHAIAGGSGALDTALDGLAPQEGFGNEYLQAMDQVQDLRGFAAVIYSSNFEYEVAENTVAQRVEDFGVSVPEIAVVASSEGRASGEQTEAPQPREATDSLLGESEVIIPEKVALEETPGDAPQPVPESPQFEEAWKKALAEEDGRQQGGAGGRDGDG